MKLEEIKPAINNTTLTLYRVFSIFTLYAVLAGVLIYAAGAAFYAMSSSWVAPVIVSPADKDSLELRGKLISTQSTLEDLKLDVSRLRDQIAEAEAHKTALLQLQPELERAIARERKHRVTTGPVLASLTDEKSSDIVKTQEVLQRLTEVDAAIDRELAVGLITKTDAAEAKAQFAKSNGDLTDSKISALLLKDNILEREAPSTSFLEILHKRIELKSEIATLNMTIEEAGKQIEIEAGQIARLNDAITTAQGSPSYLASSSGKAELALVPYENRAQASQGAPVYDCYLSFLICRQVGTVTKLFNGEQHATHPIFRTDLRGFLVELELTNPNSAKSKTLFLGGKPLLI
jgi:hypothetical protein